MYKLSQELSPPHQSDVKAVIPLPGDRVATASRDQSVGIWKRGEVSIHPILPPALHVRQLDAEADDSHRTNCKDYLAVMAHM